MTRIDRFLTKLTNVRLDDVFNPYADICVIHDHSESPKIRLRSLRAFLQSSVELGVDSIWFGRDLGYRGGRRTGIALTDEKHLPLLAMHLKSKQILKATASPMVIERTASVVWGMIDEIGHVPFMWNAFPFHPHQTDDVFSNRNHTRGELSAIWELNLELIDILKPRHFVAIGNDAHAALNNAGLKCSYVRHPSYGGQADFVKGLRQIYGRAKARSTRTPTPSHVAGNQLELID